MELRNCAGFMLALIVLVLTVGMYAQPVDTDVGQRFEVALKVTAAQPAPAKLESAVVPVPHREILPAAIFDVTPRTIERARHYAGARVSDSTKATVSPPRTNSTRPHGYGGTGSGGVWI